MNNMEEIVWHHVMPAQLRFSDVDQFGHVNNSVYFSLFDMCKTKYIMEVVGEDMLSKIGIVVASIKADFIAPIFYPDEIVIMTAITRLGNKSFEIIQRAVNNRTKDVKCECHTTMVAYDISSCASIPLPQEFKAKVIAYEEMNE